MHALDLLSEAFLANHPDDAARTIEGFAEKEAARVLSRVTVAAAAEALARMAPHDAGRLLAELGVEKAAAILDCLELQDAASILRTLQPSEQGPLLAALGPDEAQPISLLLMYPEGTAGAYMDPRVLAVPADITVDQAQQRVRVRYQRSLYYLYVIDRDKELVGVVNLRELFIAPKNTLLTSIARRSVARVKANARRNAIVTHPRWRELHTLPVVDDEGRFLGAIRYRTLRRLETESANEGKRKHPLTVVAGLANVYALGVHGMLSTVVTAMVRNARNAERSANEGPWR